MESAAESNETEGHARLSHIVEHHLQHEKSHGAPPLPPETQTVDDVLELAVHDVGVLIPAERSVLFVYDKSANQLKPQFVFPHSTYYSEAAAENADTPSSTDHDKDSNTSTPTNSSGGSSSAVATSFPPVMGMISACFLHKRCLRMQEPHPVRSAKLTGGCYGRLLYQRYCSPLAPELSSTARSIATTTRRRI